MSSAVVAPSSGAASESEEAESSSIAEETGEDEDDEASEVTSEEEAIEEAAYAAAGLPAAGLSPRLVVRRGVEELSRAAAPPASEAAPLRPQALTRMDTMLDFQEAVGASPSGERAASSGGGGEPSSRGGGPTAAPLALERVPTMSSLREVRDAFTAVDGEEGGAEVSGAANGAVPQSLPPPPASGTGAGAAAAASEAPLLPVRRVDTMDLLTVPGASDTPVRQDAPGGAGGERRSKRPRQG